MRKIKIIFLSIFVIILIISIIEIRKDNPYSIVKKLVQEFSLEGNNFKFKAKILGILPVAEIAINNNGVTNFKNKQVYHLSGSGKTCNWLSPFLKAEAFCESYVDKNKLYSLQFKENVTISNHQPRKRTVIYDQENLFMEIIDRERRQILPNTHDQLSAMFYLQQQEFSLGKEFDLNINTNQKNYQFKAKIVGKKDFFAAGRKIGVWIVKAEVKRRDKSRRHSTTAAMWLMDNKTKTPLLFKVMTPIGPITIRLTEIS